MRGADFCLAPPGHAQWSLRTFESMQHGCVPVTFNEGNQMPWSGRLDYSAFTLNVAPSPGVDATETSAFNRSASSRQMASPRPVPVNSRV